MLPRMCAKVLKSRADQLVFEQGLTESREQAKRLIMAGEVQVAVPEGSQALPVAVDKPGHIYPAGTRFQLTAREQYVSRGAYKLLTIMDAFHLDVQNWVCLDAGASTGGFTDCLLQRGAAKVYAVDVGHNQLHEKLKADPRVVNLEGVNLRAAAPSLIPEEVDLVVADVRVVQADVAADVAGRLRLAGDGFHRGGADLADSVSCSECCESCSDCGAGFSEGRSGNCLKNDCK